MGYKEEYDKMVAREMERFKTYNAHELGNAVEVAILYGREGTLPLSLKALMRVVRERLAEYDE